ncbi:MAG: hypothetical protein FWE36_08545 [Erysipelotrichales bacterium]|nr:hypothetical protein [Erysipelotrichales bacterium]
MSEKEIFNEGKKRLAKKFYYQYLVYLALVLLIVGIITTPIINGIKTNDIDIPVFLLWLVLLFLSFL